jgi:hypothetical protein
MLNTTTDLGDDIHISDGDDTISVTSTEYSYRRYKEDVKLSDPECRFFMKYMNNSKKKKRITYYVTNNNPGQTIRDAVNGTHYSYNTVGSRAECLFFKVAFTQGKTDRDSETLFYISPNDYEKHMNVKLTDEVKSKWRITHDKHVKLRSNRRSR